MKRVYEACQTVTIKGDLKYCAEESLNEKAKGFEVEKVKRKILWPYFWKRRYTVKMKRYFLIDEHGITQVPSTKEIKEGLNVFN